MTTKELITLVNKKERIFCYLLLKMIVSFSIPWINQLIIDKIFVDKQLDFILFVSLAYLIFAFISVFLHIEFPRQLIRIKEEINANLRKTLLQAVQENEKKEYLNSDRGEILTIFESDINRVSQFLVIGLKEVVEQSLSLIVTIITLLVIDWRIGMLSMSIIPVYLLLPILFKSKLISINKNVQNAISDMNSLVQEILIGLVQIRIFNKQASFLSQFQNTTEKVIEQKVREVFIQKLASSTIVIYWIVMLCVLWIGGIQVLNGKMTIGVLFVMINYVDRIEWPVARIAECYSEYQIFLVSKNRWNEQIVQKSNKLSKSKIAIQSIETIRFENVTFIYPESEKNVFEKVTIKFKKDDVLGIVGKSGVGKSTFFKLLFAFQNPTRGDIYINDISLADIELTSYRKKIGYLSQESYLFERSLFDNILLSNNQKTEEDVYLAAREAGADLFILELKNGYQSIYGEGGLNLSQGQKQRIALARIFLMDPDVIVLDEPTSSLDRENTRQIIEIIKRKYGKGKIVLMITHDILSLNNLDQIVTITDGQVERKDVKECSLK